MIDVTKNDVKPPDKPSPADFETAASASGHGLFNYLLLFAALPCCAATLYETSTMSYVLPSADCDLHLTLTDKGILNAVTYAGERSKMIRNMFYLMKYFCFRHDSIGHSVGLFIR